MKRLLKIFSALLMICMVTSFVACGDTTAPDEDKTTPIDPVDPVDPENPENPDGNINEDGTVNYRVIVKAISGKPLSGFEVLFLDGSNVVKEGITDANGSFVASRLEAKEYAVEIETLPGYTPNETEFTTDLVGTPIEVTCTTYLVTDEEAPEDTLYTTGSAMYDATIITTDGYFTISEELEKKDLVILNFWFAACGPCKSEFPPLNGAYLDNSDVFSLVAINPGEEGGYESLNEISAYKNDNNLDMPMGYSLDLVKMFNVTAFPTTVFIDRFGTADYIHSGAITDQATWEALIDEYLVDDYTPEYKGEDADTPDRVQPTVEFPGSEAIESVLNSDGLNATYSEETQTTDAEFSWPWVPGEGEDGQKYIYPSNTGTHNSFATLHANVELEANTALVVDFECSTEPEGDIVYILVDGNIQRTFSGASSGWTKGYIYVANETATYDIVFIYLKNNTTNVGDDTFRIRNLRTEPAEEITEEIKLLRNCANDFIEDPINGFTGYQNYINPVLGADGLYHVDSATGPLVLLNVNSASNYSNDSLYSYANNKLLKFTYEGFDYDFNDYIVEYATAASNSSVIGFVSVNEDLKAALDIIVSYLSTSTGADRPVYDEQWLELCYYYNIYGSDEEQISDPIKGLLIENAYETKYTTTIGETEIMNEVEYDRFILPRGFYFKFTPSVSGVYKIQGYGDNEVFAWVFDGDGKNMISQSSNFDVKNASNMQMYGYFIAGETYYIRPALDVEIIDTCIFSVAFVGEDYKVFTKASPGYFVYDESDTNFDPVTGGIDIALNTDTGYYHHVLARDEEGKVTEFGSELYVDFDGLNTIFLKSLKDLLFDDNAHFFHSGCNDNNEIVDPSAVDYTAEMRQIYNSSEEDGGVIRNDDINGTNGCIKVTERVAVILQAVMDNVTFSSEDYPNIGYTWAKLCYYYLTLN